MKRSNKNIQEHWMLAFQLLLGVLFFIGMFLVTLQPESRFGLLFLAAAGGGANFLHGWKLCQEPKWKNQGMSMMLLGAAILILGVWLSMPRTGGN